jgi:hypothetical protein
VSNERALPRMAPYQVYLRAELAKLRSEGDALKFLRDTRDAPLQFGLPLTVDGLRGQLATPTLVDAYVMSLSDDGLMGLTELSARSRGNDVGARLREADCLRAGRSPIQTDAALEELLIVQAEPAHGWLWRQHGNRLLEIAHDPVLAELEPYRQWPGHRPIEVNACLATRVSGPEFCIFDGVHRAIQMVWNGALQIRLCVV